MCENEEQEINYNDISLVFIIDILKKLEEIQGEFITITFYSDYSGSIDDDSEDVELFYFNNISELLEKADEYIKEYSCQ